MEATAADLLAALSSPPASSHTGLYSRYAAYLQPFAAYLPTSIQTGRRQPPPPPDAATALRPLAKRFLPFLSRAAQLLPPLLRATPNTPPRGACTDGGGGDDEDLLDVYALVLDCLAAVSPCLVGKPYAVLLQRGLFVCCLDCGDDEDLLDVYALVLDCLAAVSPCLAGKPYAVLLQRGRFVCCLESRGRLAGAGEEAAAALDALRSALSPPTTSTTTTRSRSPCGGDASGGSVILPDPGVAGDAGTDPDVAVLGVELTVWLIVPARAR